MSCVGHKIRSKSREQFAPSLLQAPFPPTLSASLFEMKSSKSNPTCRPAAQLSSGPLVVAQRLLVAWALVCLMAGPVVCESRESLVERPRSLLGNTEASVERALGKPLYRTVEKSENWHHPLALDDRIVLYYSGLTVVLRFARPVAKSFLTGIVVSDPNATAKLGVVLPASEAAVRKELGAPQSEGEEGLVYTGRESPIGEDSLVVVFRRGELAALVWRFALD